jgi:iron complex transport system permease protein
MHGNPTYRQLAWFVFLGGLFLILAVLSLGIGSISIPFAITWDILLGNEGNIKESWVTIVREFRIPKLITAILAGMALSVSGLQMQSLFRNPLAGPYVLGVSSGAALGVALLILSYPLFGMGAIHNVPGNWSMVSAAWLGAGIVLLLIFLVSLRIKNNITLLILGVLIGSAASAIVSILQYFSDEASLKTFVIWTMGSLGNVSNDQLNLLIPVILFGLILSFLTVKSMNAWMLGESNARSLGVNLRRSRIMILLSTSILAGSITAFCGPIGFIGIAVPHITRMIFQTANHHLLFPGNLLVGSILMIFSDLVSQLPGSDLILPINSITALIGIPVVIYLVLRNQQIKM